ncbi:MAG TPA: hypothetical protein VHH36_02785 [Candidatus Thermoplasmatota archaeon]|nr:hypothetical protein [Candidatus Thermoplasmatota archaeon]
MSHARSPTLRDLHAARPHPAPRPRRAWDLILEDPDLAPAPRREVPLTAWA